MTRFYYVALVGATIFLAYVTGQHVGNIKCDRRIAQTSYDQIVTNNKIIEQTNEKVFHTGVRNMRRILHDKYTIAE